MMHAHAQPEKRTAQPAAHERPATASGASGLAVQRLATTGRMLNASGPVVAQRALGRRLSRNAGERLAGGGAVVQAKLFKDRAEIPKATEGVSPIVRQLLDSGEDYVLRGNCQVADEAVHVIDRSHKYLLGEQHGTTKWAERTAHWDVDTMAESGKSFPETAPVHAGEGARNDQPLESIHAYTVAVVLQWRQAYNAWLGAWMNWIKIRHSDPQATKETREFAEVPGASLENWAQELLKLFKQYKHNEDKFSTNPKANLLVTEIPKFKQLIKQMMATITDIQFEQNEDLLQNMLETKVKNFGTVMSNMALVFTAATGNATNRAAIVGRAKGALPMAKDDETNLTNPLREAAMIHNIAAARAPLFVKIGNNHVGRVHGGVAGSVAVAVDADFDAMTRATDGHIPPV